MKGVLSAFLVVFLLTGFFMGSFISHSDPSQSETETFQLKLKEGWNLVSVPLIPQDPNTTVVFGQAALISAWRYNPVSQLYERADFIQVGIAYWIRTGADATISINGTKPSFPFEVQIRTKSGQEEWDSFGIPSMTQVSWGNVIVYNLNIVTISYYDENTGRYMNYTAADLHSLVFEPGRGYWIQTRQPGSLLFSEQSPTPSPSPSPIPSPSPSPSPTPTPSPIQSPLPTITPFPSPTPTNTSLPSPTPSGNYPELGVKVGDWVEYDSIVGSTTHHPYMKIDVLGVSGPPRISLTLRKTSYHASAGLDETKSADFFIMASYNDWVVQWVIPSNSKVGDTIITGWAHVQNHDGTAVIRDETARTYAGATRHVLRVSFSVLGNDYEVYYDKQTGVLLEGIWTNVFFVQTTKAVNTNIWQAGGASGSGIPFDLNVVYILLIVAVAIALLVLIAARLRKKRAIRKQTQARQTPADKPTNMSVMPERKPLDEERGQVRPFVYAAAASVGGCASGIAAGFVYRPLGDWWLGGFTWLISLVVTVILGILTFFGLCDENSRLVQVFVAVFLIPVWATIATTGILLTTNIIFAVVFSILGIRAFAWGSLTPSESERLAGTIFSGGLTIGGLIVSILVGILILLFAAFMYSVMLALFARN